MEMDRVHTSDSPLDFSTKKVKLEHRSSDGGGVNGSKKMKKESQSSSDGTDSPCSRLRNILSMKSPVILENLPGTILNLSQKESPPCDWMIKSDSRSCSSSPNSSSSCSPVHNDEHDRGRHTLVPSPRGSSVTTPNVSTTTVQPPAISVSTNINPMNYSPYGVFTSSLSPVMNQTVPSSSLPSPFETSPPIFSHHISTASSTSPNLPFGSSSIPPSNGTSGSKVRTTRPFKAYPKDPMSFSAVGLYGLPLGTTPGSTEALIHQQSHVAYAEFRKQMLSQAHMNKSRRGGQRNNGQALSDSTISSPNEQPLNYGPIDVGNNSSAEDSHSAPEDNDPGLTGHGKNSLGKTEQQLKDEAYWERRRKNNEAAKRSRDARRAKEDEIAIRAAFLEQENLKLRFELCALKNETAKLRCMLYSS